MSLPLYNRSHILALEQEIMRRDGLTSFELMQRAGQTVAKKIKPLLNTNNVVHIVCGLGNNAGDGFVIATALCEHADVRVYTVFPTEKLSGDAQRAFEKFKDAGGTVRPTPAQFQEGVIVDAIFGLGLNKPLTDDVMRWVKLINDSHCNVVAVDLPTGLHPETGALLPVAVQADVSYAMIGLKLGMVTANGLDVCGQVHCLPLAKTSLEGAVQTTSHLILVNQEGRITEVRISKVLL